MPEMSTEGNDRRLLIVDDEPEIVEAIKRQFRKQYEVHIATDVEVALEKVRTIDFQVVISDQRMPKMTGSRFFQILNTESPETVRLLITAYSDLPAVIAAVNEGRVFRYIAKPWDSRELAGIVAGAFERNRILRENRRLNERLTAANRELEARVRAQTNDLKRQYEELIRLNHQKDEFLQMAAHDLRSPAAAIRGFALLLQSNPAVAGDPDAADLTLRIRNNAGYMLELMRRFLEFTRIREKGLDLHKHRLDLEAFLSEYILEMREMTERRDISFTLEVEGMIPEVDYDDVLLRQVLENLLKNAVRHSPRDAAISIVLRAAGAEVEVLVEDSGPGIPEAEISGIFDEFRQVSEPPAGSGGFGLGLAIARKIVEAHGGTIGCQNRREGGCRFYFTLPLPADISLTE